MAHIPQEGKGIYSPQKNKQKPTQPDWKGQIMHNGEIIKISGWIKQSQYGEFHSIAVDKWVPDPNYKKPSEQQYPKEVNSGYDDSEVPF